MLGWSLLFSMRSCRRRISRVTVRSGVTFIAALFVFAAPTVFAQTALEGRLDAIWGDPHRQSAAPAVRILTLTEDDGEITELYLSKELLAAAGGFFAWNGKRVRVTLRASGSELPVPDLRPGTRQVAALTLLEGAGEQTEGTGAQTQGAGVSGSHPWVSILCKFNDIETEPRNLAFFQGMYANAPGGLDDYWREVSYDNIDVVGSTAVDWVNLPQDQNYYIPTPGSGTGSNLFALFDDCTAAADPFVDFSNGGSGGFSGINMMFNAELDCCAWGGGRFASLDGVAKSWRTTWNPPWAFSNSAVIAHEMGHGFGLPHANNWDDDGNPYDSPWDVMSDTWNHSVNHATYGGLGKHVNMYHKSRLEWVSGARLLEVADGENVTATIDAAAVPASSNYYMARLPIPGDSRYYTVEVRKRIGNYDGNLPDDVVIIHEVVPGRSEPSWSYDAAVPPADFADNEGTMWRVGETFTDGDENIVITIDSETANGFVVTINRGVETPLSYGSGFE